MACAPIQQRVRQRVAAEDRDRERDPRFDRARERIAVSGEEAPRDGEEGEEHERLAQWDVGRAEAADHHVRLRILPPAGAVREVLVEADRYAGGERGTDRHQHGGVLLGESPSRIPQLDDDARPGERHPDRRGEKDDVGCSEVVEAAVRDPVNQPPIDRQLEEPRDDPHLEEAREHRAVAQVQRGADQKAEVGAHRAAGRWERRERGDERQAEPDGQPGEPRAVGGLVHGRGV
jgi:hypothetical protein